MGEFLCVNIFFVALFFYFYDSLPVFILPAVERPPQAEEEVDGPNGHVSTRTNY